MKKWRGVYVLFFMQIVFGSFDAYTQNRIIPMCKLLTDPVYEFKSNKEDVFFSVRGEWREYSIDSLKPNAKNVSRISMQYADSFYLNPDDFPNVQDLSISGYNLVSFPKEIFKFKNLQMLSIQAATGDDWYGFNMLAIPDEISELKHLKVLELHGSSGIFYLPQHISQLKELKSLRISNSYSALPFMLPPGLACMPSLYSFECNLFDEAEHQDHWTGPNYNENTSDFSEELKLINSYHELSFPHGHIYNCMDYHDIKKAKFIKPPRKIFHYYQNGQISISGTFNRHRQPEGNWKYYYSNGTLKEDRYYLNGRENGHWFIYDSLGQQIANIQFFEDSTAHFIWYHPNGKINAEWYYYKNNFDKTFTIYDQNGSLLRKAVFDNGNILSVNLYYEVSDGVNIWSEAKEYIFENNVLQKILWKKLNGEINLIDYSRH